MLGLFYRTFSADWRHDFEQEIIKFFSFFMYDERFVDVMRVTRGIVYHKKKPLHFVLGSLKFRFRGISRLSCRIICLTVHCSVMIRFILFQFFVSAREINAAAKQTRVLPLFISIVICRRSWCANKCSDQVGSFPFSLLSENDERLSLLTEMGKKWSIYYH